MLNIEESLAATDLNDIVGAFNSSFTDWEDTHKNGANFRFVYNPETGRKYLKVMDIGDVDPTAPMAGDPRIDLAGQTVAEALAEQEPPRYPELAPVVDKMQSELKTRVRGLVTNLLIEAISEGDLLLLSALGIDGRVKILDVFSEECQTLKEEFSYGTSRTGYGA